MQMPEPKTIEGAQILIWVLSSALVLISAAALWFLKRYFASQDEETASVKNKLSAHEKKMSELAATIGTSAESIRTEMMAFKSGSLDFQRQINQNIADHKNNSLDAQRKVNSELADLEKHATNLETILDRTREKADDFDKKLGQHITQVKEVTDHVTSHAKVIRGLAEGYKQHKVKLEQHDQDYSTIKKELGNIVIIKKKPDDQK